MSSTDPITRVSVISTGTVSIRPEHVGPTWKNTYLWLFTSRRWFLQPPEADKPMMVKSKVALPQIIKIASVRDHGEGIVANVSGVTDRNGAEALRGARIFISRSAFPSADPNEYYWVDLIGLDVVNRDGVAMGRVVDLMATGPQTVLVLEYEADGKKGERMIPFVGAYVDNVDLAGKKITVDWQPDY